MQEQAWRQGAMQIMIHHLAINAAMQVHSPVQQQHTLLMLAKLEALLGWGPRLALVHTVQTPAVG